MATIADIGTPGQPLNSPSLVAWQAAVRDAIPGKAGMNTNIVSVTNVQFIRYSGTTNATGYLTVPLLYAIAVGNNSCVSATLEAGFDWVIRVSAVTSYNFTVRVFNPTNLAAVANAGVIIHAVVAAPPM